MKHLSLRIRFLLSAPAALVLVLLPLALLTAIPASAAIAVDYSAISGTDASGESSAALSATDLNRLRASDNARMRNDGDWPKTGTYDEGRYIEFVFSPAIPENSVVTSVSIAHEYRRSGALAGAKLEVWDGAVFTDRTLTIPSATNSDLAESLDVTSLLDTPAKVNAFRTRFLAFRSTNGNTKTSHDVIRLSVAYESFPTLTVIKQVINDNGGVKSVSDFSLLVNTAPVISGVSNSLAPGSYTVSERSHDGYLQTFSGDCAADGTVTLGIGDAKVCTITNDDIAPSLTLIKNVDNTNGGSASEAEWTLTATGPTTIFGTSPVTTDGTLQAGTYTLSEAGGPDGYISGDWSCIGAGVLDGDRITLDIGQSATCTLINFDQPGTLIVKKIVINDEGGTKEVGDFSFQINGGIARSFESDGQNDIILNAGTYTVTEVAGSGYTASYDNCAGIVVPNGDTTICAITNDDIAPKLTVIKVVVNGHGGTLNAADVPLFVDGNPTVTDIQNTLNIGAHTVSETPQSGYLGVIGGDCAADGSIVLSSGDRKVCTITNTDTPGTLVVRKVIVGGTAVPSDFSFQMDGGIFQPFEGDGENTLVVDAGTHTITEQFAEGYVTSYEGCTNILIGLGETRTCVITNTILAGRRRSTYEEQANSVALSSDEESEESEITTPPVAPTGTPVPEATLEVTPGVKPGATSEITPASTPEPILEVTPTPTSTTTSAPIPIPRVTVSSEPTVAPQPQGTLNEQTAAIANAGFFARFWHWLVGLF